MKSIIEMVGNTPLVEVRKLNPNPKVRIFAKMESNNPGGSVKDRPALSMISEAEKKGTIDKNSSLIEPTSGNTGIALALIASVKGYSIELVMPENATKERIEVMRSYGAKVTLTLAEKSIEGSIDYVHQKLEANKNLTMLNQFANPDNPLSHYRTTAPEIWRDTNQEITHFVSAMGTTGTIMGNSRFFKEQNPDIQIIGAQPTEGSNIPGIRRWSPEYLPKIYQDFRVDQKYDVSSEDAIKTAIALAKNEGIFCGISAGGAMFIALKLAEKIKSGVIVSVICDNGERYLSSNIFGQE